MGVTPITRIKKDNSSLAFNVSKKLYDNVFIFSLCKNNIISPEPKFRKVDLEGNVSFLRYGGCSILVVRTVVVRKKRVRFSPSALERKGGDAGGKNGKK